MDPTPPTVRLHLGDCLAVMRGMEAGSVDAVVADPPAGINFMSLDFDGNRGGRAQWVAWLAERLAEARRVVRPGHYALVWSIPRTSHWTGCAIEDAGWTIIDRISHIFGQGFPKSKARLKPAVEDWWWIQSPLSQGTEIDIMVESSVLMEALLWSMSPASIADRCSESVAGSRNGSSVRWLATLLHVLSSLGESAATATFNSPEVGSTFWSIAWSWSSILAASSSSPSTFTTGTGLSLTTAWKTLNSWISAIMPEDIIRDARQTDGLWLNAEDVGRNSSGIGARWKTIPPPSVAATVTEPTLRGILSALVGIAESSSLPLRVVRGSSVRPIVMLDTGQRIASPIPSPIIGSGIETEDWWLCRAPGGGKVRELGIDACRIPGVVPQVTQGVESGSTYNGWADKPGLRLEPMLSNPHPAGRYPPNLAFTHHPDCAPAGTRRVKGSHGDSGAKRGIPRSDRADYRMPNGTTCYVAPDGTEEVAAWVCHEQCPVRLLDEMAGERKAAYGNAASALAKTAERKPCQGIRSAYGEGMESKPCGTLYTDSGSASRFFPTFAVEAADFVPFAYHPKASKRDRGQGNTHPTAKNTQLMMWLCRLICPPGGTILDPFLGSGSTALAAVREGFGFVGVEENPEYLKIAERRLADERARTPLLA